MGLFKKRGSKSANDANASANQAASQVALQKTPGTDSPAEEAPVARSRSHDPSSIALANSTSSTDRPASARANSFASEKSYESQQKPAEPARSPVEPHPSASITMVPQLIDDLATSTDVSGEKAAKALRSLFALSEHNAAHHENRTAMVREADGQLVPVLLEFLRRSERSSSEQYLCLLVLNNIGIPSENKRFIAIDCGGAHVLSRLLCDDPSCHLMAIVLVNLSFVDAELRSELVDPESDIEIVDALSYALRIAMLSPEEQRVRADQPAADKNGPFSPKKLLAHTMAEDYTQRVALDNIDGNNSSNAPPARMFFDPSKMLFPETARWSLCALKNLTRPSNSSMAAKALTDSGIVPLILRIVIVGNAATIVKKLQNDGAHSFGIFFAEQPNSAALPTTDEEECIKGPVENLAPDFDNDPSKWDSNSMQDAALYIILNLAATSAVRSYLRDIDAVHILSLIAQIANTPNKQSISTEMKQREFQCLKAKMAVAFLIGSEGHFGQQKNTNGTSGAGLMPDSTILTITVPEAQLLLELLTNTIHQRAKENPGGYSAATFSVKSALFAIRCLLTSNINEYSFYSTCGMKLNLLLLKVLAMFSIQLDPNLDAECAEHACFSLYLLSSYGFQSVFLPKSFDDNDGTGGLLEKVLTSYIHVENITPAGRHAAEQILLRLKYLIFYRSIADLDDPHGIRSSDYEFGKELLSAMEVIKVEMRSPGAKPLIDIFARPILRSRAPKKGDNKSPWSDRATVSFFPNALNAMYHLSFGSTKVRHVDAIDDILIANNIASSANGQKTESYNYWWSWQDKAPEIQKNLERVRSDNTSTTGVKSIIGRVKSGMNSDAPMTIFGLRCGCSDAVFVDDDDIVIMSDK